MEIVLTKVYICQNKQISHRLMKCWKTISSEKIRVLKANDCF